MQLPPIPRHRALALLDECTGDDIWSLQHCRLRGVPESWIDALADGFESGFRSDDQTIYVKNQQTNQYSGVRDVDLVQHLGRCLGVDVDRAISMATTRQAVVSAVKQALMDGE